MNYNELASHVAKKEGLKKPVSIAQVKEILGIVADVFFSEAIKPKTYHALLRIGLKRFDAKKKARKAK
jgi:hypothetical protein